MLLDVTSMGYASANSVESDLGCTLTVYFDNVTLLSQRPCQHNNKSDCLQHSTINVLEMKMLQMTFVIKKHILL